MGSPTYGRTEGFDIWQNPVRLSGRNIQRAIRAYKKIKQHNVLNKELRLWNQNIWMKRISNSMLIIVINVRNKWSNLQLTGEILTWNGMPTGNQIIYSIRFTYVQINITKSEIILVLSLTRLVTEQVCLSLPSSNLHR